MYEPPQLLVLGALGAHTLTTSQTCYLVTKSNSSHKDTGYEMIQPKGRVKHRTQTPC